VFSNCTFLDKSKSPVTGLTLLTHHFAFTFVTVSCSSDGADGPADDIQ